MLMRKTELKSTLNSHHIGTAGQLALRVRAGGADRDGRWLVTGTVQLRSRKEVHRGHREYETRFAGTADGRMRQGTMDERAEPSLRIADFGREQLTADCRWWVGQGAL